MEIDKRVEGLEGEFKLIKGEVKQSLIDIRDYVLEGKPVPQSAPLEEEPVQEVPPVKQMDSVPPDASKPLREQPEYEQLEEIVDEVLPGASEEAPFSQLPPFQEEPVQEAPFNQLPPLQEEPVQEAPTPEETDSLPAEASKPLEKQLEPERLKDKVEEKLPEPSKEEKLPEASKEEKLPEPSKEEKMSEKASGSMLQANQLPNLIRWVSVAKREIGSAQLPTFLEAYGVRGQLSSEMKEVILHLAVVVSEQPAGASPADLWSRLTLELHGILTDGSG